MTIHRIRPTIRQLRFVADLKRQLHLTGPALDHHCITAFGCPFAELDKQQVSDLLDEMQGWKAAPADLQREMGQLDLIPPEVST